MVVWILMFVWGMQTERLRLWMLPALIGTAIVAETLMALISGRGADFVVTSLGAVSVAIDTLLYAVIFGVGYAIGRYRRRGQVNADDISDTFS